MSPQWMAYFCMRETILFNCAEDAEACSEVVSFSQRREYDSRSSSLSITCAVASEEVFFLVCVCVCVQRSEAEEEETGALEPPGPVEMRNDLTLSSSSNV